MRECVERGNIPYSAVTQPWPLPRKNLGTLSSMVAVHNTRSAAHGNQNTALGMTGKVALNRDIAKIGRADVGWDA